MHNVHVYAASGARGLRIAVRPVPSARVAAVLQRCSFVTRRQVPQRRCGIRRSSCRRRFRSVSPSCLPFASLPSFSLSADSCSALLFHLVM